VVLGGAGFRSRFVCFFTEWTRPQTLRLDKWSKISKKNCCNGKKSDYTTKKDKKKKTVLGAETEFQ
jgi:hypothetical protein